MRLKHIQKEPRVNTDEYEWIGAIARHH